MTTKHVMLSYQWGCQDLVRRVYSSLLHRGYNVWMDIEGGINGDINDCMAYGVENSAVIVCFLTERYEGSVNCKRELSYADRIGVTIIPVLVEAIRDNGEEFLPSGWLGILTSSLHYISLTNHLCNQQYEDAMQALIEKLEIASAEKRCRMYARQASISCKLLLPAATCPQIQITPLSLQPHIKSSFQCDGSNLEKDGSTLTNSPQQLSLNFQTQGAADAALHLVTDPLQARFESRRDSANSLESAYEVLSRTVKETAKRLSPRNWRKNYVA